MKSKTIPGGQLVIATSYTIDDSKCSVMLSCSENCDGQKVEWFYLNYFQLTFGSVCGEG